MPGQRNEKKLTDISIIIHRFMDLNHIELSGAVVAGLYPSSLISTNELIAAKPQAAPPSETGPARADKPDTAWKSLGSNQKNILLIVNNRDIVFLPDNELTFLTGILSACQLTLADIALVNLSSTPALVYQELITHFKSRIVLLFDVEPATFGLPMNFPHYQIQPFSGCSFLYAPSLKQLENDRVEKSKLWVCLKRLFNL